MGGGRDGSGGLTRRRERGFGLLHGRSMKRKGFEGEWAPATLGTTAGAHLLLRVWCTDCLHRADIDPGEEAERNGADLSVRVGRPAHLLSMRQPSD